MKKTLFYLILAISFAQTINAQVVNIPDANFKSALILNPKINTNADNEIQVSEAVAFSGTISVSLKNIENLTGIEAFVNLGKLYCSNNKLTSLNVSSNTVLTSLYCSNNRLANLDVSKNITLTSLYCDLNELTNLNVSKNTTLSLLNCSENQLTTLDVSKNTLLSTLHCHTNQLTNLDVTKNITLTSLFCNLNKLTNLNVSKNTTLSSLNCSENQLTSLDVSKNTVLTTLDCYINQLTNLDVTKNTLLTSLICYTNQIINLEISKNIKLTNLLCNDNKIANLNASKNTELIELYCESNQLTYLNIKNGENNKLNSFFANNNPLLTCIIVDYPYNIGEDWTKDTNAKYSADCEPIVDIPDANFKKALLQNPLINTNKDSEIQISEAVVYSGRIYVTKKEINSLTGIEAFINLKELVCIFNNLTTLDVSKNTALTLLYCNINQLTTLDVSKNIALKELWCHNNRLTTLDVSKNIALIHLECYDNKIPNLDVSKNIALFYLYCSQNQLKNLDINTNTALNYLFCDNNQLTTLDVSKNIELKSLWCDYNQLTTLNLKNGTNNTLEFFRAYQNLQLKCIQVDDSTKIGANWLKDNQATYSTNCSVSTNDEAAIVPQFKLYPNPASQILHIDWQGDATPIEITLYNSIGAVVKTQQLAQQGSINIADLPRGLYLCRINDAKNQSQTVKVVVE